MKEFYINTYVILINTSYLTINPKQMEDKEYFNYKFIPIAFIIITLYMPIMLMFIVLMGYSHFIFNKNIDDTKFGDFITQPLNWLTDKMTKEKK